MIYVFYTKTQQMAIENAQIKVEELLLNYKAVRNFVSKIQKEEIFKLQGDSRLDEDYFHPILLSSTYGAKSVNKFYNSIRLRKGLKPIDIKFASNNPRNPKNQATQKESKIIKKFETTDIENYKEIVDTPNGAMMNYYTRTQRTTQKCMLCHSTPNIAPKELVQMYGDKNGFNEKVGGIRAIIATSYPLDEDLSNANKIFLALTFITTLIFIVSLFVVHKFFRSINSHNDKLEELNKSLDKKVSERTKELDREKKYIRTIVDTNPSIIIVTDGEKIIDANKRFHEFFDYKTLDDFLKEHSCICDYFTYLDGFKFNDDHLINGQKWCDYLYAHQNNIHMVTIEKNDRTYYFNIHAQYINNSSNILITLQNITELKDKEKQLAEQSKLASMGEMIGNIAHQWRQPLSAISTGASGMRMQKEYNMLSDEKFYETCDAIDENAQYLSTTIEELKNYIKDDKTKQFFKLKDAMKNFFNLANLNTNTSMMQVVLELDDTIEINGYKNELIQCFVSIYNNTNDAFKLIHIDKKLFFITTYKENNTIVIKFKDNAGGIDTKILSKIFEPYTSTKHKSQGIGLGLSKVYSLIVDGMKGTVEASNVVYNFEEQQYSGAEFTITIPTTNNS
jgi:C4-dicarboxylate-specific signal transduction histidine kinase